METKILLSLLLIGIVMISGCVGESRVGLNKTTTTSLDTSKEKVFCANVPLLTYNLHGTKLLDKREIRFCDLVTSEQSFIDGYNTFFDDEMHYYSYLTDDVHTHQSNISVRLKHICSVEVYNPNSSISTGEYMRYRWLNDCEIYPDIYDSRFPDETHDELRRYCVYVNLLKYLTQEGLLRRNLIFDHGRCVLYVEGIEGVRTDDVCESELGR